MSAWLTLTPPNHYSHNARLNAHIISGAVTEEATINLEGETSKLNQARFRGVAAALHNKHRPDRSHNINRPNERECASAKRRAASWLSSKLHHLEARSI